MCNKIRSFSLKTISRHFVSQFCGEFTNIDVSVKVHVNRKLLNDSGGFAGDLASTSIAEIFLCWNMCSFRESTL